MKKGVVQERYPDLSLRPEPCSKGEPYLYTTTHKNTSTPNAKKSAMGLESTLPEAVPWNGAIAGFVVFNVELPLRLTLFVAPPVKAVIVDVGVIVRRDVSV